MTTELVKNVVGVVLMAPLTYFLGSIVYTNLQVICDNDITMRRLVLYGGIAFAVGLGLILA